MMVYIHGSPDKLPVPEHTIIICPGKHLHSKADLPADWFDSTEKNAAGEPLPVTFPVKFHYGQAEVPDAIGKYMVVHGLAQKSRLIVPNAWDR